MRFGLCAVLLASLAACSQTESGDDSYGPPPQGYYLGCASDSDCTNNDLSGEVCARDGECLPTDEVQHIATTWTVAGSAASDATCTSLPSLQIQFTNPDDDADGVGFAPVPCNEGKFTVDKMPSRFTLVTLGNENDSSTDVSGTLDGSGNVSLDLP